MRRVEHNAKASLFLLAFSLLASACHHDHRTPLPEAPVNVAATAANAAATITWTAPSGTVGTVTYTATSSPGGLTCTTSGTSCTVTGLTNGTTYTFTVIAANSAGTGPSSAPSSSVTPNVPLPGAPTAVTATAGNSTALISWAAPSGTSGNVTYTVTSSPGGLTCTTSGTSCTVTGLANGTAYTFSVTASNSGGTGPSSAPSSPVTPGIFAVSEGPKGVIATPGNQEVTIAWSAPSNTGPGTISSYDVTYGSTSGVAFTTSGCDTTGTSCTVTGLTNGTAYTFAVSTTTTMGGSSETGPANLSSSVAPVSGLAVSPAELALSGLGGGATRSMAVVNTSASVITLSSVSAPTPALPAGTTADRSSSTDCSNVSALAPGQACTITIQPGAASSSACTSGTAPTPSVISIIGNGGSLTVNASVVILGYGCQYQGGYLFTVDDTTPTTASIGGTVVATADQAAAFPNGIDWSPSGALDSLWGIDDNSTPTQPDPNASSLQPSTLTAGQMNCDGINDGSCNTNNVVAYYQPGATYAGGLCRQSLNSSGAVCTGGAGCYADWYLPSVCELGPWGSTGTDSGTYPGFGTAQCGASTNIQNQLVSTGILSALAGYYWSSTEFSGDPQEDAWVQDFASSGGAQSFPGKNNPPGARCVRRSTL